MPKAKKPSWCYLCRERIKVGQDYSWHYHKSPFSGGIRKDKVHKDCGKNCAK